MDTKSTPKPILNEQQTELFKDQLRKNGYNPDVALGNLFTALKLTPEIASISSMPVDLARIIIAYTTEANRLKQNWPQIKAGKMRVSDINFIIPERNVRGAKISLKDAKAHLKLFYWQMIRGHGYPIK